jgi:hypothetical protein
LVVVCSVAGRVCAAAPDDAPAAITPVDGNSTASKPIEARDVFWGGKHGELHHGLRLFLDGRLLEGADQYLAVDRPDLAKLYLDRENQARTQGALGGVLVVGGLFTMVVSAAADRCSRDGGCETHNATGFLIAGLLGTVIGWVTMADVPDPQPISDDELRGLVDAHNSTIPTTSSGHRPR